MSEKLNPDLRNSSVVKLEAKARDAGLSQWEPSETNDGLEDTAGLGWLLLLPRRLAENLGDKSARRGLAKSTSCS